MHLRGTELELLCYVALGGRPLLLINFAPAESVSVWVSLLLSLEERFGEYTRETGRRDSPEVELQVKERPARRDEVSGYYQRLKQV